MVFIFVVKYLRLRFNSAKTYNVCGYIRIREPALLLWVFNQIRVTNNYFYFIITVIGLFFFWSLQHWIMCSFSVIFITWPFILYISTINDAGDVFSLPSGTWRFLRSTRKLIAIGLQNIFKTRVNYCINAPLFYHLWGLFQDFENKEKKAHSTFRRFSAIVLVVH